MLKRTWLLVLCGVLALAVLALPGFSGAFPATPPGGLPGGGPGLAPPSLDQMPYSQAFLAQYHGWLDNKWTAQYEQQLQAKAGNTAGSLLAKLFAPLYGADVRMSNGAVLGSNQNEFQIDVNPSNNLNAIGTSNDGGTAGVGIFRTLDGGVTWTSADASTYGVQASCCDPGVAYGQDGKVYAVILDTSPAATYIIRSTDGGVTWQGPSTVSTPDRENIAVDPTNSNVVYVTYSDLPATNRIKGYKSTDGGVTWGSSFFVGDVAPASGYEQSSQPRVANNGWLYVGYQQYTNSGAGCAAGVQNVVARSTDGGTSFSWTTIPIIQGGACIAAQAGRGIFCVPGGSSFRSRSHPIMGISPTNPNHVYMVYSGGDLEPTNTYSCGGGTGNHSDTLFIRSTDGGATFTAPIKINTDPDGANKDQYYPWMSVNSTGQIWVGWNDRREDTNDLMSRWYQSYSNDEGTTWLMNSGAPGNDPVADVMTSPNTFIGDYHGLGAAAGRVMGMWFDSRISAAGDAFTDPQLKPAQGTPTPTVTGTPPTATRTSTAPPATSTTTRTPTPNPCLVQNYTVTVGTGAVVPGTTFVTGSNCDDCSNPVALPFPVTFYGQTFNTVNAVSNGNLQFNSSDTAYTNTCLPDTLANYAMLPHWDDMLLTGTNQGIYTLLTGTAPNRTFNIEWTGGYFSGGGTADFEVRLHEGSTTFEFVYGVVTQGGSSATIGVQKDTGSLFTQWECNTGGVTTGLMLTFSLPPCNTPTITPPPQPTNTLPPPPTNTPPAPTNTIPVPPTNTVPAPPSATRTQPPVPTNTQPVPTATHCALPFTDTAGTTFESFIRCLYCNGIISGYSGVPPCATSPCFLPNNPVTRGQVSKMISNAAGLTYTPPNTQQSFADVPPPSPGPAHAFWLYIERLYNAGAISGYTGDGMFVNPCTGLVEQVGSTYFRPCSNVTRGQLAKIDSNAKGYTYNPPATQQSFADVPPPSPGPAHPFWLYIERVYNAGVISGYSGDGVTVNPCTGTIEQIGQTYFRPCNFSTRGQTSKIVANTFYPSCNPPR